MEKKKRHSIRLLNKILIFCICLLVFIPNIVCAGTFINHAYIDGYADFNRLADQSFNCTGANMDWDGAAIRDVNISHKVNGIPLNLRLYNRKSLRWDGYNAYIYPFRLYGSAATWNTGYPANIYEGSNSFFITAAYVNPRIPAGYIMPQDVDQNIIEGRTEWGLTQNPADANFEWGTIYQRSYCDITRNYNEYIGTNYDNTTTNHWGMKYNLPVPTMNSYTLTYNLNASDARFASGTSSTQSYQYVFKGLDATVSGYTYMPSDDMKGVYATSSGLQGGIVSNSHADTIYFTGVYGDLTIPAIAKSWPSTDHTSCTFTAMYQRPAITLNNIGSKAPTRTGYTFTGWYKNSACTDGPYNSFNGTDIRHDPRYGFPTGNHTLYAGWSENYYNISYNLNGGSFGTYHPTSAKYTQTITISNPTKYGYRFAGWTISNANISSSSATSFSRLNATNGATVTFTANWVPNTYTVSIDTNDISWTQNPSKSNYSFTATYDQTFNVDNIGMTGYVFNGWDITGMDNCTHYYGPYSTTASSLSKRKETSYKNLRASGGTVTMKANWTVNGYNLRFDYNPPSGHTVNEIHDQCTFTRRNYDDVFEVPTPRLKGYLFNGWNISGMTTNNNVAKRYGTGNPPSNTFPNNKSTAYHACGPTVAPGQEQTTKFYTYSNLTEINNATVTFKARINDSNPENPGGPGWTPIKYKVTIDPNAGTINGNPNSYEMTEEYDKNFQLPTPVRDGYEFLGWQIYSYSGKSDYSSWVNTNTNPLNNVCNRFSAGTVKNLCYTEGSTIKLVAIWKHSHATPNITNLSLNNARIGVFLNSIDPTGYASSAYYVNTNESNENYYGNCEFTSGFTMKTSPKWYNVKAFEIAIDNHDGVVVTNPQTSFIYTPSNDGTFAGITKNTDKLKLTIKDNAWCNIRPKVTACCTWEDKYTKCASYNQDLTYSGSKLTVIGDCEAPTLDDIEKLEDLTAIDLREVDEYLVKLVGHDDDNPSKSGKKVTYPSGIETGYFKIVNSHNLSNKVLNKVNTLANGLIMNIKFDEFDLAIRSGMDENDDSDDNLFNGTCEYEYFFVDNVGNQYTNTDKTSVFDLSTTISSFTYKPTNMSSHTKAITDHQDNTDSSNIPKFKKGEAVLLDVTTMGYVDALEIEFPSEWYTEDYPLYLYLGDTENYEDKKLQPVNSNVFWYDTTGKADANGYWHENIVFILPLYADEAVFDNIKVTAYRGNESSSNIIDVNHNGNLGDANLESLSEYQYFEVSDESVLDDYRDSIYKTYRGNGLLKPND